MQKDKLTLLRRELAHVRSSGRLSFYRATARDLAGSACEVAWYHKSEDSLAYQQAGNLLHATQSLKSAKKSCFCVVIRLKTSQNKKNMQPFTSYQDKSVVLDTPSKIPRLNHPIFPHTVEILYLFGILRINTRVSGMLACRYPCAFISGSGAGIPKRYKISA